MAYSGKYIVKHKSKYQGDSNNVVYRSLWERNAFKWCDDNPSIQHWSSEEIVIPYKYDIDKRVHRYFMDLKIKYKNGKTFLIEIKPDKQTRPPKRPDKSKRYIGEALTFVKNQNKWKAADNYAKDRGWHFQVWTEKELEKLGIIPKPIKPLKPLKPYRRKIKKVI